MGERIKVDAACVDLDVSSSDRDEILRHLSHLLEGRGYVGASYADAIVEREHDYPTGLPFEHIAIAMPHADPDDVHESAIAIGRCSKRPLFNSMETPGNQLPVDLVVLLAVKNPEMHLAVLSNLIQVFCDGDNCALLKETGSKEDIRSLFESVLLESTL